MNNIIKRNYYFAAVLPSTKDFVKQFHDQIFKREVSF